MSRPAPGELVDEAGADWVVVGIQGEQVELQGDDGARKVVPLVALEWLPDCRGHLWQLPETPTFPTSEG